MYIHARFMFFVFMLQTIIEVEEARKLRVAVGSFLDLVTLTSDTIWACLDDCCIVCTCIIIIPVTCIHTQTLHYMHGFVQFVMHGYCIVGCT